MTGAPPDAPALLAWHGTTEARAQRIGTVGLLAGAYLADNPRLACYYAAEAAEVAAAAGIDEGEGVVIELYVARSALGYDANAMNEPVLVRDERRDDAWAAAALAHPEWVVDGYIRVPPSAWEVSWNGVGSVRITRIVSARGVRRVARADPRMWPGHAG